MICLKKTRVVLILLVAALALYGCGDKKKPLEQDVQPEKPQVTTQENEDGEKSLYTEGENSSGTEKEEKFFAIIEDRDKDKRSITVDKAQILFGGQDDDKIRELGEEPDELPNGYLIANEEKRNVTLPFAEHVNIGITYFNEESSQMDFKTIDEEAFFTEEEMKWKEYFYVTLENGSVTDLHEQYIP